jgi:hypothetical protein
VTNATHRDLEPRSAAPTDSLNPTTQKREDISSSPSFVRRKP